MKGDARKKAEGINQTRKKYRKNLMMVTRTEFERAPGRTATNNATKRRADQTLQATPES